MCCERPYRYGTSYRHDLYGANTIDDGGFHDTYQCFLKDSTECPNGCLQKNSPPFGWHFHYKWMLIKFSIPLCAVGGKIAFWRLLSNFYYSQSDFIRTHSERRTTGFARFTLLSCFSAFSGSRSYVSQNYYFLLFIKIIIYDVDRNADSTTLLATQGFRLCNSPL